MQKVRKEEEKEGKKGKKLTKVTFIYESSILILLFNILYDIIIVYQSKSHL